MRKLVLGLFAVLFLILHMYLAPAIRIVFFAPDFILIFLCCLLQGAGPLAILGSALFMGIAVDITTAASGFTNTFIYLLIAIGYSVASLIVNKESILTMLIAVITGGAFRNFILMFALYIKKIEPHVSFSVFLAGIPSIIYTAALAVAAYFLFKWLFSFKFMQNKPHDNRIFLGE